MSATKFYYLAIPDTDLEFYFSLGAFNRQISYSGTSLTISNLLDKLPKEGGFLWGEMEECSEEIFNHNLQVALFIMNGLGGILKT